MAFESVFVAAHDHFHMALKWEDSLKPYDERTPEEKVRYHQLAGLYALSEGLLDMEVRGTVSRPRDEEGKERTHRNLIAYLEELDAQEEVSNA